MESERRKERLRTLRLKAEQQPVQAAAEAETLPSPLLREASRDTSFDYYTDPLAVYEYRAVNCNFHSAYRVGIEAGWRPWGSGLADGRGGHR